MASILADRTNSPAAPGGTPAYYKLSPAPAEDEISSLPIPPPPPAFDEDVAASIESEEPASASSSCHDRSLGIYAAGHATFLYLYVSDSPIVSVASWLVLTALIVNGVKMSITASNTSLPAPTPEQSAYVVDGLNAAVKLLNRFIAAEPKLTFVAALSAWGLAVASSYISPLALAWVAFSFTFRLSALSPEATDKLNKAHRAAHSRAVSLYAVLATPERIEWAKSNLGPRVSELEGKLNAFYTAADRHAETAKVLVPLAGFFYWSFMLGWTDKLLVGGMALLGYKAWASPEAVSKLDAKIGSGARKARRMTMSACEAVNLVKRKSA